MATDLTNSSRTSPRPYRSARGDYQIRAYEPSTAASTALIRYGDVVSFDVNTSSNNFRIVKSTSSSNAVLSSVYLGIALGADDSDGSTTGQGSKNKIPVCLADHTTEFLFPTKATVAQHQSTLVNTRRAIVYDSTLAIYYCDVANSSAAEASLLITDVLDPGSSNGQVLAKFHSTSVARTVSGAF
jgi:hypothetical protein